MLVPYYNYEVKTKFTEEGIHYDQLSPEDKARYEDDFTEDATLPTFIPVSYTHLRQNLDGHLGRRHHQSADRH